MYGKLIGGLIGLASGGFFGLILGGLLGHVVDRAVSGAVRLVNPEQLARIRQSFFETTFLLSGYLAKADGQISASEIAHTEQLFTRMGLSKEQREEAIALFRRGASADFALDATVAAYLENCGRQIHLQQTLLLFLVSLAYADQSLEAAERAALLRIADLLGFGGQRLEHLLRMAEAQGQFHQHGSAAPTPEASVRDAYAALGVPSSVSDRELKQAYRKLMNENHPDKMIARGVPESMLELATQRSQQISSAYDLLCRQRGIAK